MTAFAYNFHYKPTGITANSKPAGLSLYGINGDDGVDGLIGSTTYFFDSLIITDLQKETILTRMDNGRMIDGSGPAIRSYVVGDLIICKRGSGGQNNVYKVVESPTIDHRFDLQLWGVIAQPLPIHALIDYYLEDAILKLNLREKYSMSLVPVNRSFDSSTELYYTNGDGRDVSTGSDPNLTYHIHQPYINTFKRLYGFELNPSITFTSNEIPNAFDFYLKITIPLKKGLVGTNGFVLERGYTDCYNGLNPSHFREEPMNTNRSIVKFEKILEIPMNKYANDTLCGEFHHPTYVSDISADKLHPTGNNINVSFFDPKRSKGWEMKVNPTGSEQYFKWFRMYIGQIGNSPENYCLDGRKTNSASYTIGHRQDFYDTRIENVFMSGNYDSWHPMMQFSKRKRLNEVFEPTAPGYENEKCVINFRSGESAYFSGMVPCCFPDGCFDPKHLSWGQHANYIGSGPYHTYDAYVTMNRSLNAFNNDIEDDGAGYVTERNDFMQDYMYQVLYSFIFKPENTFELVYVEKATGLAKSKKLNVGELQFNHVI